MGVEVLLHCLSKLPLVGKSKAWSKNGNLALWWGPKPELCLFASILCYSFLFFGRTFVYIYVYPSWFGIGIIFSALGFLWEGERERERLEKGWVAVAAWFSSKLKDNSVSFTWEFLSSEGPSKDGCKFVLQIHVTCKVGKRIGLEHAEQHAVSA